MKIRKLFFHTSTFVGPAMVKSVDLVTHDISQFGPGYIAVDRRSGLGYVIAAANATAEVDLSEDDNAGDAGPTESAIPRRGSPAAKQARLPPG